MVVNALRWSLTTRIRLRSFKWTRNRRFSKRWLRYRRWWVGIRRRRPTTPTVSRGRPWRVKEKTSHTQPPQRRRHSQKQWRDEAPRGLPGGAPS